MKQIQLTQSKIALIDNEDFEDLNRFKWCAYSPRGYPNLWYATRREGTTTIRMHQQILNVPKRLMIDHIDGDGLNNSRSNLRTATNSLNQLNQHKLRSNKTSKFRGVSWCAKYQNWQAGIKINGIQYFLGRFADEKEASEVYERTKKSLFGMTEKNTFLLKSAEVISFPPPHP